MTESEHDGREWMDEEIAKFNDLMSRWSAADPAAREGMAEEMKYAWDELHQGWRNRNTPGPFAGPNG